MHEGQDQEKQEDPMHEGSHILPQYCKYSSQICTFVFGMGIIGLG